MDPLRTALLAGGVIPAHPLALTASRKLDERRQRALTRYYRDAGAAGVAVAVHTTQFAIRDPHHGLLEPVLALAEDTLQGSRLLRIAGAVGDTRQAVTEASLARELGYQAVLLSLGALRDASERELVDHCREVSAVLPLFGFYLQPAVGGRVLPYSFWRAVAELPGLVAIKVAPFDRYRTLEVLRAVADSGRRDVAVYTGNDDSIITDLLTTFDFASEPPASLSFSGGLLGQFAVWTHRATQLVSQARAARASSTIDAEWLQRSAALTDANAALFDAANGFAGCIPGIHEALRRSGLLEGTWCLDENESLSPGQLEQIDRVHRSYPWMRDDEFVSERLDDWLK
jgi:dihydrodipicolinate synthase/N-acetylneuraminate lyase